MAQPIDIAKLVLPISLGFGGLGLYTLLPWRGGNTGWIGTGLLCCCLAGISVHLANPAVNAESIDPAPSLLVYAIGTLGVVAVAGAIACVVSPDTRSLLVGFGTVIAASSLLVAAMAGWPVGAACLVINSTVAARMWRRVAPNVVFNSNVETSDPSSEFTSTRESPLAVIAGTGLAASLLVWGLPPLTPATDVTPEVPIRHGYLLVSGMLLIVLLAFIGSLTSERSETPVDEAIEGDRR